MQSNRTLALIFLVVLAVAGVISWQFLTTDEVPLAPNPGAVRASSAASDPAEHATSYRDLGAEPVVDAATKREAVEVAPAPNLPAVIGQVVDATGNGVAEVEVVCMAGFEFGANFEGGDLDQMDLFDPDAMFERINGRDADRAVVRTDVDGRFRVRHEGTSKMVRLRVLAIGHRLIERTVQRPSDRDTDVGTLTLEIGAVVTGRVVDVQGSPVAGARVMRMAAAGGNRGDGFGFPGGEWAEFAPNVGSSVTDEAGRFELAHIEAGEFSIRASHKNYPTAVRSGLSVAAGHTLADILVTMPRSATIRGVVSDLPADVTNLRVMAAKKRERSNGAGDALMGVLAEASDLMGDVGFAVGERQCEIGEGGKFVLQGLDADNSYRIWVAQRGRGFAGSGICSKRVEAMTDTAGVALRYEQGVTVTFAVVDAKSGAPIEALWVRDQLRGGGGLGDMMAFAPSNARQRPYPGGMVTVANLRPKKEQKLTLTIDAIGYGSLEQADIELPAVGSKDLGTLRLEAKPVIHVTVLNAYRGQPLSGARVTLSGEGRQNNGFAALAQMASGSTTRSARCDADGRCSVNAIEGKVSVLSVKHDGFAPVSITLPASERAVQEQIVRLIEGGTVAVTVLDPERVPVPNVRVQHRMPDGSTDDRTTDANGVAQFANLVPDLHDFRIAANRSGMGFAAQFAGGNRGGGDDRAWQSVDVEDQETSDLSLTKDPAATLTGIVRENGVPLEDATVSFQKGATGGSGGALDEEAIGAMMGLLGGGAGGAGGSRTKSDEEGLYLLTDLPAGEHSVRVSHKGRAMPSTMTVTLQDGENRFDIDLSMTTLRGVVLDSNGKPVAGAEVSVAQKRDAGGDQARQLGGMMAGMMGGRGLGGAKQKSNAQGEFELRGVAADVQLEVRVTASALSPVTELVTVALGQTKGPIELVMSPAGRIEVTLEKAQMFAALQAKFVGADAEGVAPVMQVVRGTTGALEGLKPGAWEVTFLSMSNRDPSSAPKQTVNVVAGETATVAF